MIQRTAPKVTRLTRAALQANFTVFVFGWLFKSFDTCRAFDLLGCKVEGDLEFVGGFFWVIV